MPPGLSGGGRPPDVSGDAVYTCLEAIFAVILGNLPESIAFLPKI